MQVRTAAVEAEKRKEAEGEYGERRWGIYALVQENAGSEQNKKG